MWDVFISHASEDKDEIARPLADALVAAGLRVWYDDFALKLGDSLGKSIDHGLAETRYGIVILSPAFFAKEWPRRELDGLNSREISAGKIILPVWHKVDRIDVERFSPILADKLGVSTDKGLAGVVHDILQVLHEDHTQTAPKVATGNILNPARFITGEPSGLSLSKGLSQQALTRSGRTTFEVRNNKRTVIIGIVCCLMLLVAGGIYGFYKEVTAPSLARAQLNAWPLEYSANSFIKLAGKGDQAAVELFLAAGINPDVQETNRNEGDTALMAAARNGHIGVIRALLDSGANVNRWVSGYCALFAAAAGGQLEAVRLLMARGAAADAINRAVYYAADGGYPAVISALYASGAKTDSDESARALRTAAYGGHNAAIAVLLDHGVDVNGRDSSDGFTALTTAVRDDRIQPATLLLERGADIDAPDKNGWTPLMWVTSHEETARFLIDKGANIRAKDKKGVSVLAHAITQAPYGAEPIVDLLLARDVDPNLADNDGETPLMVALRVSQSINVIEKLLKKGAIVHVKDSKGYTPLMLALKYQVLAFTDDLYGGLSGRPPLVDVVRVLLQQGARVDVQAKDGENLMSLAKQLPANDQSRIIKLLRFGAKA